MPRDEEYAPHSDAAKNARLEVYQVSEACIQECLIKEVNFRCLDGIG